MLIETPFLKDESREEVAIIKYPDATMYKIVNPLFCKGKGFIFLFLNKK
jgi:hypothetical protein